MATFDPDAYLDEKEPKGGFDPDAYLESKRGYSRATVPSSQAHEPEEEPTLTQRLTGAGLALGGAKPMASHAERLATAIHVLGGHPDPDVRDAADIIRAATHGATLGTAGHALEPWDPGSSERFETAAREHPIAEMAGGAVVPLPVPGALARARGLLPAAGRTLLRGAELGGLETGAAKVRGEDPETAGLRGIGAGVAGGGLAEAAGGLARAASAGPQKQIVERAAQILKDKLGASGDGTLAVGAPARMASEARALAEKELSSKANASLGRGIANIGKAALSYGAGSLMGGPVGTALGAGAAGWKAAQAARQVAQGLIQRPGALRALERFDRWGPALAKAAVGGAGRLAATLFTIQRHDPEVANRAQKAIADAQ